MYFTNFKFLEYFGLKVPSSASFLSNLIEQSKMRSMRQLFFIKCLLHFQKYEMLTLILSTKIQNCLNFKFEPTQILIDTK